MGKVISQVSVLSGTSFERILVVLAQDGGSVGGAGRKRKKKEVNARGAEVIERRRCGG
jgi:hypothetical protein